MKISLSRNVTKKTKRNLNHEVSTTADFGFCQPIVCREMVSQDTFSLRLGQIVRLQPLVAPTFGSIKVKNYTAFVPFADIFHPYESLLAGQTYAGSASSYIPVSVPKIRLSTLAHILTLFSSVISKNYTNKEILIDSVQYAFETTCKSETQVQADFEHWLGDTKVYELGTSATTLYAWLQDNYHSTFDAMSCDGTAQQISNLDFYADVEGSSAYTGTLLGFKYNRWAKNLRKILIGCGYQIDGFSQVEVSILPLIAYYKVWFDYFQPARDKTWKDTAAFALMEFMEQTGLASVDDYLDGSVNSSISAKIVPMFGEFLHDLSICYHVANVDYTSAHITGVSGSLVPSSERSVFDPQGDTQTVIGDGNNTQAYLDGLETSQISAQSLDILKKLTQRISIHTAIGGRIKEFLRAVYNSDYVDVHDSYQLGTSQFDVQIDPVFSTAETAEGSLGEFAGRALGSNDGSKGIIRYTAKVPGILITLTALVPEAKMAQGIDPNLLHLKKEDFYDLSFDGSTLVPTRQVCIYGMNHCTSSVFSHTGTFGNIPIYTEYKVANNKLNGDMSKPSTMASFLPYTLDKLLPLPDSQVYDDAGEDTLLLTGITSSLLAAGSIWRFTNLYPWIGNYNRIFTNSGNPYSTYTSSTYFGPLGFENDIDDNFILHNFVNLEVVGMPRSLKDSWYTGAGSDSDMNVEQA